MHLWETILIAVGLGMDAMSVSAAIGVKWHGPRQKFRLAWHMGVFQFAMPLAGWLLGAAMAGVVQSVGTYVASGLVFLLGLKMLWEALKTHPGEVAEDAEHAVADVLHRHPKDPTRGWSLLVLSVATSIDALVVGVSLALQDAAGWGIWAAAGVIGMVAAAMALIGVVLGKRIGRAIGRPAEIAGAVVLMGLAVSFLVL
jgi:putative Mn2+ efflux pump MntP